MSKSISISIIYHFYLYSISNLHICLYKSLVLEESKRGKLSRSFRAQSEHFGGAGPRTSLLTCWRIYQDSPLLSCRPIDQHWAGSQLSPRPSLSLYRHRQQTHREEGTCPHARSLAEPGAQLAPNLSPFTSSLSESQGAHHPLHFRALAMLSEAADICASSVGLESHGASVLANLPLLI